MRKALFITAAFVFPAIAQADSVNIKFVMDTMNPAKPAAIISTGNYGFEGTSQIVFKIFGKTCTFVGGARVGAAHGCNYSFTANVSTGLLSTDQLAGGQGCSIIRDMSAVCK